MAEAAYVVLSDAYAPVGVYRTTASLQKAVNKEARLPPSRKDGTLAFPASIVNQKVEAYLEHRPKAEWIRVFP